MNSNHQNTDDLLAQLLKETGLGTLLPVNSIDSEPPVSSDNAEQVSRLSKQVYTIYISGLADSVTKQELRDFFSKFGEIVRVQLLVDSRTGMSRGFAFISFDNEGSAIDSLSSTGSLLSGKPLIVEKARQQHPRTSTHSTTRKPPRNQAPDRYRHHHRRTANLNHYNRYPNTHPPHLLQSGFSMPLGYNPYVHPYPWINEPIYRHSSSKYKI